MAETNAKKSSSLSNWERVKSNVSVSWSSITNTPKIFQLAFSYMVFISMTGWAFKNSISLAAYKVSWENICPSSSCRISSVLFPKMVMLRLSTAAPVNETELLKKGVPYSLKFLLKE